MEKVAPETIELIRKRLHEAAAKIIKCSLPWTPWALAHLLDIDDSSSAIPAELILYQALRGKGRTGIGQCDPIIQVHSASCIECILVFNLLTFVVSVSCWQGKLCRGRYAWRITFQMWRQTICQHPLALLYGARRLKGQDFVWSNG